MKIVFALVLATITLPALAAEPATTDDSTTDVQFGGTSSVPAQIKTDTETKSALTSLTEIFDLEAFDDFKKSMQRDYGLAFGLDYNALYQYATPSTGESSAASGVFRFYGTWKPANISASHPGSLVFKLENRHRLGTSIAPQQLANEVGYAGLTGVTFSNAGSLLTNLYWAQNFNNNNFAYIIGQVDGADYVDVYGLGNIWVEFNNLAFTTNPTIPVPKQGLGGAVRWTIKNNYYVLAGIADANGDPDKPFDGFDSFFNDHEYFKHIEFGWAGSWEQRFSDNSHLTLWQVDERKQASVPDGWGAAFSFNREFGKWLPFLRAGYADGGGALVDRSISTGFRYMTDRKGGAFGVGLNWGRANQEIYATTDDNQYTVESYYRVQVLKHLQIVPDIQLLLNPAFNPDEDRVWVYSLRARLAF